jgi:hypothetical protein
MPDSGFIKLACPNVDGNMCALCGQIAYRIITVESGCRDIEVAVCGQHYLETLRLNPETRAVTDRSLVQ